MDNSSRVPAAAGWHEDPEDSRFIRYWNGRQWGQPVLRQHDARLSNGRVYRPRSVEDAVRQKAEDLRRHHAVEAEPAAEVAAPVPAPLPAEHFEEGQPTSRRERRRLEREHIEAVSIHAVQPDFGFVAAPLALDSDSAPTEDEQRVSADGPHNLTAADAQSPAEQPELPALPGLDWDIQSEDEDRPPVPTDDTGTFDIILGLMEDDDEDVQEAPDEPADEGEDELPAEPEQFFFTSKFAGHEREDETTAAEHTPEDDAPPAQPSPAEPAEAPVEEWIAGLESGSEEAHLDPSRLREETIAAVLPPMEDEGASPEDSPEEIDDAPEAAPSAAVEEADEDADPDSGAEEGEDEDAAEDEEPSHHGLLARLRLLRRRREDEAADEGPAPVEEEPEDVPQASLPDAEAEDEQLEEDGLLAPEEPQIKAGPFASRQLKEAKALEAELVGRVNGLRERIIDLMAESDRLGDVIEDRRREAAELKELVDRAHEEHDLLDQLAKTRRREMEDEASHAEEMEFRAFIDAQTARPAAPVLPVLPALSVLPAPESETESDAEAPSAPLAEEPMTAAEEPRTPATEHATEEQLPAREDEPVFELPALEFPPLEFAEGVL